MRIIKTIYQIGLLTILLASCSSNQTANKTADKQQDTVRKISLADITNFLSTETETFEINQTKDTLLYCKRGTVIFLPANSFQFQDGTSPDKPVKIEVKECYSLTDFIGDNLSTVSDNTLLETAGMINIKASLNGKEVFVKKEKEYAIYFPKNNNQKEMNLFYGNRKNDGVMNWIYKDKIDDNKSVSFKQSAPSQLLEQTDTALYECNVFIVGYRMPNYSAYELKWKKEDGSYESIYQHFKNNFKPSKNLKTFLCTNGDSTIRVECTLYKKTGKLYFIKLKNNNPVIKQFEDELRNYFNQLPLIDMSYPDPVTPFIQEHSSQKYYDVEIVTTNHAPKKNFTKLFRKKYRSFKDQAISKIDKSELNSYVLTATKFGWINCDKLFNTPDEKINFFVKANSPNNTTIKIVFSNYNSIMDGTLNGDKFVFNNVPINSKIKIIGISYNNNKPTMSIAHTRVDKDGFTLTGFKEFTLDQLETELNKIN